jgi:hypothetical protein
VAGASVRVAVPRQAAEWSTPLKVKPRKERREAVRFVFASLAAAGCLLVAAAPATAATPIALYDGSNPFKCKIQRVGTGVDYPHSNADPFCVGFDKTNQNVTDFGIVDFLLNEPARVAAATPKCFYYQVDHWTGSIVQGGQPTLWHWDGKYFFDKARGVGGVRVKRFSIGGQTADPRLLPGFPTQLAPYFGPGRGGAYVKLGAADPSCAARVDTAAEAKRVYRRWARQGY